MERALACFVSGRVSGLCRGVVAVVMLAGEGGLAWACHRACRPRHAYDACGSARPCCCRGMACGCQAHHKNITNDLIRSASDVLV